jgi:protocatechuate 3,4-dioxygenase beta subunit
MAFSSRRRAARPFQHPGRTIPRRTADASVVELIEPRTLLSSAVIFADGFEGTGSALAGWTLRTHSGGSAAPKWGPVTDRAFAGQRSAFAGGAGRTAYSNDQHTGLVREHVSLAGFGSAALTFKYYLNTEAGYDFFSVNLIDAAAGSTKQLFRDSGDDRASGWQAKTIDLSAYAGRTDLGVEFRFDSDHTVARAAPSGVWVDDVRLTADTKSSAGTIKGTVFDDADGDHVRDTGEGPLAGWVVYLDRNQNRRRDSNESFRTTDSSGRYTFTGVAPGTYYVATEGRSGFAQTSPTAADVRAASAFHIDLDFADSSLNSSRRKAFAAAAGRWEHVIVGDLPDVRDDGVSIDDVRIDAAATEIDGPGGVLAQSSPSALRDAAAGVRNRAGLPYRSFVEIDAADLPFLERSGTLLSVVTHEMAHALGFGTLWEDGGLLKNAGSDDPRFTGPVAVAQYDAIFGSTSSSVPVEGDGAPGTRDSHWRESPFGHELMTGYVDPPPDPISRITVGSLADLGYVVDLSAADEYVPPGGHPSASPGGVERPVTVSAGKTRSGIDFGFRKSNRAPTVGSLTVTPSSSPAGTTITLKAGAASDADGKVIKVGFYRESNGEAGVQFGSGGDLLLGTDSDPSNGFSIAASTAGLAPGTYTYYAVAADDKGAASPGGTAAPSARHTVQSTGRIRGSVFRDADADGARDAGEGALSGARVYLDANGNDRFDSSERSVLTDSAGEYAFDGLATGSYTVRMVPPDGYLRTAPSAGEYAVTLGAGQSVTLRSFGAAPQAQITGRVFEDADGDGAKDGTESGLAGWRVFADANDNGALDAGESWWRTGSNGTYTLVGLRPGRYTVRIDVLSGWRVTSPSSGRFADVLLAAGQTRSGNNFGVQRIA